MIDKIIDILTAILVFIFGNIHKLTEGFLPGLGWIGILAAIIIIYFFVRKSWQALQKGGTLMFIFIVALTFLLIYKIVMGG